MKLYLLKNKIFIIFSPLMNVVVKVYVENGLVFSDIYHGNNVQRKELDCGIPIFNENIMGNNAVEHLLNMLNSNINDNVWDLLNYNDAQTEMYNSLVVSSSLRELFLSCPNLAWAIIIHNYYDMGFHVIEYYSRMKRRQLLSILTRSPTEEKIVTIIKKTEMLAGRKDEFSWLSRCLRESDIIDAYKHKDKIKVQELYLAYRYRIFAGSVLLGNICSKQREFLREYKKGMCTLHKIVMDSIRIGENIGIKDSRSIIMSCTDSDAVMYYHDKWALKLRETTKLLRDDIFLERPALLENEGIYFIDSINALIIEGREMEHCLASYKDKVINKESYIFKVISPVGERVTLEIGFSKGKFFIKQAKGYQNCEPSNFVRGFYNTWLKDENARLEKIEEDIKMSKLSLQRA
ncbi:PcfJ domain-containing protein [Kosakonia sp. R1.Fl]|uniref:PcfJ domain-containing protein n=1 Tax=Kosakonia sp. R1.Fl TaxID=2928706 RepID=UPI00201DFFDF|nr:PcfJ domain-containing protein [Kosakonia sp. R1.Fl]MCL6746420.1 PcfJ domain-containing protein [Kosakonia sp. R1.Fl]